MNTIDDLKACNPKMSTAALQIYLDARATYAEAAENISRNGAVTAHPKTGAPLVNPYLAVRDSAAKTIERFLKEHPKFLEP